MPFVVSYAGDEWRTDDLTLDEAISIEQTTGRSWVEINPFRSGEDCKAILVTFLARTMNPDVAAAKVGALTLKEVLDGVKVAGDDLPDVYEDGIPDPKVVGGASTGG